MDDLASLEQSYYIQYLKENHRSLSMHMDLSSQLGVDLSFPSLMISRSRVRGEPWNVLGLLERERDEEG